MYAATIPTLLILVLAVVGGAGDTTANFVGNHDCITGPAVLPSVFKLCNNLYPLLPSTNHPSENVPSLFLPVPPPPACS